MHFFLIFFTIFIAYAIAGMLLFGQQLKKFSSFLLATCELFEILLGDFDFAELFMIQGTSAFIWFFTYNFGVVLVLLNMLLAIIMDAYGGVKENADSQETLVEQTGVLLRRIRQNQEGSRVELSYILHYSSDDDFEWEEVEIDGKTVEGIQDPNTLVKQVPKLPMNQAKRVLERCRKNAKKKKEKLDLGFGDSTKLLIETGHKVDKLVHARDEHLRVLKALVKTRVKDEDGLDGVMPTMNLDVSPEQPFKPFG
jgi:hypothetical protein